MSHLNMDAEMVNSILANQTRQCLKEHKVISWVYPRNSKMVKIKHRLTQTSTLKVKRRKTIYSSQEMKSQ